MGIAERFPRAVGSEGTRCWFPLFPWLVISTATASFMRFSWLLPAECARRVFALLLASRWRPWCPIARWPWRSSDPPSDHREGIRQRLEVDAEFPMELHTSDTFSSPCLSHRLSFRAPHTDGDSSDTDSSILDETDRRPRHGPMRGVRSRCACV